MKTEVVRLSAVARIQQQVVGSKTARLGELFCAGFPVPDGFCIAQTAFEAHASGSGGTQIQALLSRRRFEQVRVYIQHVALDKMLKEEILENYRPLQGRQAGAVAVRSSSTAEDLARHSFAGLYETVLNVTDEAALLDAIRGCWASYWSQEAVFYREQLGMDHNRYGMAVLVQAMIQSKMAGVLFTQAPDEPETALVEFVEGGGEALVQGESRGQCLRFSRGSGAVLDASVPSTPLAFLDQLLALGLKIEALQGGPQDIEWCLDQAGRIWILQTRPVTTAPAPLQAGQASIAVGWERMYDEPFSTLGCDLAALRHRYWVTAINAFHKARFKGEAKIDSGFIYRSTPWRSAGGLLQTWMGLWKLIRWLQAPAILAQYEGGILPAYTRCLAELRSKTLTSLDDEGLLVGFNTAIQHYLEYQVTSYAVGVIAAMAASLLERLSRFLLGRNPSFQTLDFLAGLDNFTVQRDIALQRLGQRLQALLPPDALEKVDYASLQALQSSDGRAFWDELESFQQVFGYAWADRYPRDPAWQVDDEALAASLRHAALQEAASGIEVQHVHQAQRRSEAIELARQALTVPAWLRARLLVWGCFLRRAEQFFPLKENRNHHVYQGVMAIQAYAREIGRRLHVRGALRDSEDVFFLTWDEIRETFPNRAAAALLERVADHKAIYLASKRTASRTSMEPHSQKTHAVGGHTITQTLHGEPCSPGIAAGPVHLAGGLGELGRVQPGDVLVCRHLRPAWSQVFPRIAAVVIEEGGILSHGATLAREYGIPAVTNIPGVTRAVQDGWRILVDGDNGLVRLNGSGDGNSPSAEKNLR
ncbi:MAG: hypothetical protein JXB15_10480 [Anaerolineales bacterium]|nr:hypothetical protein [Anaerolineales bacterium]